MEEFEKFCFGEDNTSKKKASGFLSKIPMIIGMLFIFFIVIFAGGEEMAEESMRNKVIMFSVIAAIPVIGIIFYAVDALKKPQKKDYNEKLEELKARGIDKTVIDDFESGQHWFNDNLVFGDKYIFGRNNKQTISIGELTAFNRYNEKKKFRGENGHMQGEKNTLYLEGTMLKGEKKVICKICDGGSADEEWRRFLIFMKGSHPEIKLEKEVRETCKVLSVEVEYNRPTTDYGDLV